MCYNSSLLRHSISEWRMMCTWWCSNWVRADERLQKNNVEFYTTCSPHTLFIWTQNCNTTLHELQIIELGREVHADYCSSTRLLMIKMVKPIDSPDTQSSQNMEFSSVFHIFPILDVRDHFYFTELRPTSTDPRSINVKIKHLPGSRFTVHNVDVQIIVLFPAAHVVIYTHLLLILYSLTKSQNTLIISDNPF